MSSEHMLLQVLHPILKYYNYKSYIIIIYKQNKIKIKNKNKQNKKEPPMGVEPTTFRLLSGRSAN